MSLKRLGAGVQESQYNAVELEAELTAHSPNPNPNGGKHSPMQTAVILAKTISGTGNFALPFAFLNMGLVSMHFENLFTALFSC